MAVIGAGPAGLACALTLERLGIRPDVFEKGERVGLPVPMVQALLTVSHPRLGDQLSFLREEYGLDLRPLTCLTKVTYHCPGLREEIAARHGYLLLRGRDDESLEQQLAGRLQTKIHFCRWTTAEQLAGAYDYVVVADGSGRTARRHGFWHRRVRVVVQGAQCLGEAKPGTLEMYLDTAYAGHGFGVLVPFGSRRAMLALHLPLAAGKKIDSAWRLFLAREGLVFDVVSRWDLVYTAGTVLRHRIGNVLLAGNAAGLTDPFLGLGLFAAMASGVLAARAVAGQGDYETLLAGFARRQQQLARARITFDTLDQAGINRLVGLLGLPGVRRLVPGGGLDVIGGLSWLARLNRGEGRRRAGAGGG